MADEVRDHRLQTQEPPSRSEALEPAHHLGALLHLLVPALDGVVVEARGEALAGYGHSVDQSCDAIEVSVECLTDCPQLVAHEGHGPALLHGFVALAAETCAYLLAQLAFQALEKVLVRFGVAAALQRDSMAVAGPRAHRM